MIKRLLDWGPAVACAAVIFLLSHHSNPPGAEWFASFDYAVHFLEYAVFALTLVWGAPSRLNHALTRKGVAVVCAVALVYALSDEWHQSFVPNRDASPVDLVADFLGSVTSVMIVYGVGQGRSRE